jgi:adenine-specific DNA methylase
MGDWISDVLLFSAGIAGGILITMIVSSFRLDKRRESELAAARARVLADIKQQHDQEILDAAFRTTEDIQGELNTSLQRLRETVSTALQPVPEEPIGQSAHAVTKN